MLIFNERYNAIVSKYIVPLSEFGVSYSKLRQNALRDLLIGNVQNVTINTQASVSFYFTKRDLLTALINDVNQFYVRTLLQREATKKMHSGTEDPSINWNIVTDYYYAYFLGGLFLRLCHRGTFYFDNQTRDKISEIIKAFTGQTSNIGNNCYFEIGLNDTDSEYKLTLHSTKQKTHELVWEQVSKLLNDIKNQIVNNSDEYTVLQSISQINSKLGESYPSGLRNRVNYRPHYGVKEVEREYYSVKVIDLDQRWLAPILEFDGKRTEDDQKTINLFAAYVKYLQTFTFNLINEYDERRGRGSGILSAVNKNRVNKIAPPGAVHTYR